MQQLERLLLFVGRDRRRHQSRRHSGCDRGTVLFPRAGLHGAPRIHGGAELQPEQQFPEGMVYFAYDYTGDGWTDIICVDSRPIYLYVNPKGESRRWDRYNVVPSATSEIEVFRDIDGDGKPEILFAGPGATLALCEAGSRQSHRRVESAQHFRTGSGRRARHGRRRYQRRRAHGRSEQPRLVGTARFRRRRGAVEIPSGAVRQRRRGDGRLRRERRRAERRRHRHRGARMGPRLVRTEARRAGQHLLRPARHHGRLQHEERRRRDFLGTARRPHSPIWMATACPT